MDSNWIEQEIMQYMKKKEAVQYKFRIIGRSMKRQQKLY